MARGGGQTLVLSGITGVVGFYILHMGIELIDTTEMQVLGDMTEPETSAGYGAVVAALGIALIAAAGKLIAMSIEQAFFLPSAEPEEVWDDAPLALQHRLHYAVSKGYSRVALKGDAFHEMMKMPSQRHVRFVGNKGTVVVISKAMTRFIETVPEEEIPEFQDRSESAQPETFWNPQSVRPVPAQNY